MQLLPYQEEYADFALSRRRAYNAFGCGLGKTPSAIVTAVRRGSRSVLTITKAASVPNWYREHARWGSASVLLAATSYTKLAKTPHLFNGADWDEVILDEAHYVKSRVSKRTLAALTVARAARNAQLLSATPMPNHPGELFAPYRVLWPGVTKALGIDTYTEWLDTFCSYTMGDYGPKVWGIKNGARLTPHLRRTMMIRKLADVGLQLPPLRVDVVLLKRDRRLLDAMSKAGIDAEALKAELTHEESHPCPRCGGAGERNGDDCYNCDGTGEEKGPLSRLRRILGTFKAARIGAIIDEELHTQQYNKIVVFAHHHATLDVLHGILERHGVVRFTGKTSARQRQQAEDAFNDHGSGVRVFLAQQTAAGEALNLQVASEAVLVEPSFVPDENYQAIKRIHRYGSVDPCRARMFAIENTLDEGVMNTCARKTRMKVELELENATGAIQWT